MKNLKLWAEIAVKLKLQFEDEVILFSTVDIERNRFFFATSSNLVYTAPLPIPQNGEARSGIILHSEVNTVDLEEDDCITSFHYLMEKEALVIGTSSGLLLLHMVDSNAAEVVGRVEGGVKCIEPSPDGDLLAVTTGLGQLIVLTDDWDVLYEIAFEEHVQGFDVREPSGSTTGIHGAPISWRGDGKYLATLSKLQNSPLHLIKVWDRDSGLLHSYSEPKNLVHTILEWMPSGGVIATVCHRIEKSKNPSVLFFERNGLERIFFDIDEPFNVVVDSLKWSSDSDLLAGIVRCEEFDCLKVWFFCNDHWYLKQEIRYAKQDAVRFMWDPTKPLQLLSWTLRGLITIYNFAWASAVTENSVALVVDHSKILVTPLSISLLPPPMFSYSLKYLSPVREIAFYSNGSKNLVAAFLSAGHLSIVELPALEFWEDLEGKEFIVEACNFQTPIHSLLHLQWLDSHVILGASPVLLNHREHQYLSLDDEFGYHMVEIKVSCSEDQALQSTTCSGWHAKLTSEIFVEQLVTCIASDTSRKGSAIVELNNGNIFEYISNVGDQGPTVSACLKKLHDMLLLPPCPWMAVAHVNKDGLLKPLIFGLDEIGRLSIDGKTLCNNCTSFSFYSNSSSQMISHLILTTKQDLLFVVEISDILAGNAESKYDNFVHVPVRRREQEAKSSISVWERGAKIVGVLDGDEAGVIFQTNRGNLECVYPRKLVLTSIINALVQKRFRDALLMVRRHRINFNIIVDYCGCQAFVQSASEFVRQVNDLSHITEFICAIKNDNMTEKLYRDYVSLSCVDELSLDHSDSDCRNKVSSVLLAIRKSLEEQLPENPARELCILTTLARSDPPALEEALKRIKVTREMEISGNDTQRMISYPSAEESLRHLLWLADPNAVYEAALGLYDLNLSAIVALNAQKDPKEFLPFLQELESMPTHMMQYKIDLRLQRYEMALKCIASAGDTYHEECMVLLRDQPQLFPLALELFTDPAKRVQIYEAWGDHLYCKKCYEDAAMTFLCCSNFEKALKAYRAGGHWRGVMTVVGLLKLGKEDVLQLAGELCEELQELGRPSEAAIISLEYCGDVKTATNLLVAAREFEEALRAAYMSRDDILILEVKDASLEFGGTLITEYEEGLEKLGKYVARYLAVRQRRLLLAAKIRSEEQSVIDDETASEASSNFSGMSAYSTGTTKVAVSVSSSTNSKARSSRRQRSRGKIRAGSPGEEMALIDHLKGMALPSEAKRQLRTILATLLMIGMVETATKVQHMAEKFQLSQMAAVKLSEDTVSSDVIDEQAHSLDRYIRKIRSAVDYAVDLSWRSKILLSCWNQY